MPSAQQLSLIEETVLLVRDLIASYTNFPKELEIAVGVHPEVTTLTLQTISRDHRILVGKEGANFKALIFLVAEFIGPMEFRINESTGLLEPKDGRQKSVFMPKRVADSYDAADAKELLTRLVSRLVVGDFAIEVSEEEGEPGDPLTFCFAIIPEHVQDYGDLLVCDRSGLCAISALQTLWRAFASKEGVVFKVEARER